MPRARKMYVATETLACEIDGVLHWIRAGETRVAADHELRTAYPHAFKEGEAETPEVEQATAAPGEKRGDPKK